MSPVKAILFIYGVVIAIFILTAIHKLVKEL